ncbi:MAG: sulfatase [Halobacteriales archaeon]
MPTDRPNVVCILADDLGWRDLGSYGSSFYETPNLDRLARDGTRFSNAYASCPVCSPTRASVMTGNYPARVGVTDWIDFWGETHPARGKLVDAEYSDHLPHGETSLASALGEAGYASAHVGKWHLGGEKQDSLPTDHGFDENVAGCEWGAPTGGGGYFRPWEIPTLADGDVPDAGEGGTDGYLPDHLGAAAVDLIESYAGDGGRGGDDPFFLNYDPYLVHTPLQAPEEAVERYERKRETLGLDDEQEIEAGGRFPAEHKKEGRIKRRLVQSHPTYAAMIEALDRNVGRVLDALERTGQAENTVVVFSSDNGGLSTAEGSPTCNRPLREGKGWMQEGGNRVPTIVRWPGVTDRPDAPEVVDTPVTSPDIYPTLLDAAGVDPPEGQAVDGESLRPLLQNDGAGADSLKRDAVFWHYPHYGNQGCTPAAAVRQGDWKLIEFFETGDAELYHLGEDVREEHDLSEHRPAKVTELRERLTDWQDDVGARFPQENPDYEPWPDRAGPG